MVLGIPFPPIFVRLIFRGYMTTVQKIKSDNDLKKLSKNFFKEALSKRLSIEEIEKEESCYYWPWMFYGIIYDYDLSLQISLYELTQRALKLLGYSIAQEKDIERLAWQNINTISEESKIDNLTKKFLDDIVRISIEKIDFAVPNRILRMSESLRVFDIGPIKMRWTKDIASELSGKSKRIEISDGNYESRKIIKTDNSSKFLINLSKQCFLIKMNSTPGQAKQEAKWLVDVAISLLRLYYHYNNKYSYVNLPPIGERESKPFERKPSLGNYLITDSKGMRTFPVGPEIPWVYGIDENLKNTLCEKNFGSIASDIFNAKEKSIAERIFQGLGWMSRARQSGNPSERFLLFFTSIESLLTSNDKTVPVVQTITRNTASILSNNPTQRYNISKNIAKLYEKRSSLVHAGKRNITINDSKVIQRDTENLYRRVIENCDLKQSFSKFEGDLKRASFGSEWPLQT